MGLQWLVKLTWSYKVITNPSMLYQWMQNAMNELSRKQKSESTGVYDDELSNSSHDCQRWWRKPRTYWWTSFQFMIWCDVVRKEPRIKRVIASVAGQLPGSHHSHGWAMHKQASSEGVHPRCALPPQLKCCHKRLPTQLDCWDSMSSGTHNTWNKQKHKHIL